MNIMNVFLRLIGVLVLIAVLFIIFMVIYREYKKRGSGTGAKKQQRELSKKICPSCGAENPPDFAYCEKCGNKFDS